MTTFTTGLPSIGFWQSTLPANSRAYRGNGLLATAPRHRTANWASDTFRRLPAQRWQLAHVVARQKRLCSASGDRAACMAPGSSETSALASPRTTGSMWRQNRFWRSAVALFLTRPTEEPSNVVS
jgi:hypothetical protein